jgi:hypothetical protein
VADWKKPEPADKIMPEITMNNTPLSKALESLFASAGVNVIIYSKLQYGSDGKTLGEPLVTLNLKKITAKQAIAQALMKYGYKLLLDTNTGIALVSPIL